MTNVQTDPTVRDLVWGWLRDCGRESVLASEVTKGLCGPNRLVSRLSPTPRDAVRAALHDLAADGLVVLTTTAQPGRCGRPGLRTQVINPDAPMSTSTHERGSENV